ncbi:MAG: tetratricopeptide repeat protein [Bacteroidota bacterium]|nr:tetratricopeptide repeat protein [Bacteroidota bacterium]
MKRIILFLSLILCFGQLAFSQINVVKQANDLYAKGDYANAAKQYEKILSKEGVAPELYFNLGNAYYKSNEIGRSILNYERALKLSPSFDDARFNLELAQLKVVDNIVPSPTFFIGRWIQNLIKLLTSNLWILISFGVFILCLAFAFLFIFGPTRFIRKFSFYFALILLGISFCTLIFAGVRKDQMYNHNEAVVMSGVVSVKSSPDKSGTDLFQLHEGAKVGIKSTLGSWIEIKIANGGIGWVEQVNIERI